MTTERVQLYPYQEKGVRWIDHFRGRALLGDEMGLGKTLQCLQWVSKEEAYPLVVVCPAHLKYVWEEEASHKIGVRAEVLDGRRPLLRGLPVQAKIIICNYDILSYRLPEILERNPVTLAVDESHYIKTRSAQRTKTVQRLSKTLSIQNVIAISGTPATARPAELWTTLNLVRPDVWPTWSPFAKRYCKPRRTPWGWEYKGAVHMDELNELMRKYLLIRRKKADVLQELPDKIRQVIPLDVSLKEYAKAEKNFLNWLREKSITKAERAAKAQAVTKMGYLKRLAAEAKLDSVSQWVNDQLEEDGKIVVMGIHRSIVEELHARFKKQSVILYGGMSDKSKKMAVRAFQKDNKTRLFFGNIQAAGTGITLTAGDRLAFAELDWTPGNHTQAEDRIHRIGQKNAARITYLVAKGTIEERLCDILQSKQQVLGRMFDGAGERETELDLVNQLARTYKKELS